MSNDIDQRSDRNLAVAKFDSYCSFCGKPTRAKQSVTWIRVERERSGGFSNTRKVGHFNCYGDGASHLTTYSRR